MIGAAAQQLNGRWDSTGLSHLFQWQRTEIPQRENQRLNARPNTGLITVRPSGKTSQHGLDVVDLVPPVQARDHAPGRSGDGPNDARGLVGEAPPKRFGQVDGLRTLIADLSHQGRVGRLPDGLSETNQVLRLSQLTYLRWSKKLGVLDADTGTYRRVPSHAPAHGLCPTQHAFENK